MKKNDDHFSSEIKLHISFKDSVSAKTLSEILMAVEGSLQESVEQALETGLIFPFTETQAATARKIAALKNGMWFKIRDSRPGSLVIVGSVALGGLLYHVLKTTIMKSVERAYEGSGLDNTITAILKTNIPNLLRLVRNKALIRFRKIDGVSTRHDLQANESDPGKEGELHLDVEVNDNDPFECISQNKTPTER